MMRDEFELTLTPEEPEEELLPEVFQPRRKPFDWQKEAQPQPRPEGPVSQPEDGGTTFQSRRRPITEFDLPVDDVPPLTFAEPPAAPAITPIPSAAGPAPDMGWLFDPAGMISVEDSEPIPMEPLPAAALPFAAPEPEPEPEPEPVPEEESSFEVRLQPEPEPEPQPVTGPEENRSASGRVSNGRTVLISGGDRGIGAAAARAFWRAGYKTAILYHTNEAAARALVNALGCDCAAVRCDVADYDACAAAFRVVERCFGQVDVLVCNAGIAQQKLFTDITPADWRHMLDVNLTGAFNLCHAALPGMIRRKWGRILTVSSMWGQTGGSCEVHYSAAKAGLIGLTKALAKEEGPSGITVNCVAPGVIETDMMAGFSAADKAALADETPVGRLGSPDEVAALLVYLAGEQAGFITGQVLGVNGGLVI